MPCNLIMALENLIRSLLNMKLGELLFTLTLEVRTLARSLQKLLRKVVYSSYDIVFNETCINEYIYIYTYSMIHYVIIDRTEILWLECNLKVEYFCMMEHTWQQTWRMDASGCGPVWGWVEKPIWGDSVFLYRCSLVLSD